MASSALPVYFGMLFSGSGPFYFRDSSIRSSRLYSLLAKAIEIRLTACMWHDIVRPKVAPLPFLHCFYSIFIKDVFQAFSSP